MKKLLALIKSKFRRKKSYTKPVNGLKHWSPEIGVIAFRSDKQLTTAAHDLWDTAIFQKVLTVLLNERPFNCSSDTHNGYELCLRTLQALTVPLTSDEGAQQTPWEDLDDLKGDAQDET